MEALTTDTFLAHYGVIGMKWGVRKDRDALDKSILSARKTNRGSDLARKRTSSEKKKLARNVSIAVLTPIAVAVTGFLAVKMSKKLNNVRVARRIADPKNAEAVAYLFTENANVNLENIKRLSNIIRNMNK